MVKVEERHAFVLTANGNPVLYIQNLQGDWAERPLSPTSDSTVCYVDTLEGRWVNRFYAFPSCRGRVLIPDMERAVDSLLEETNRRREKQLRYNEEHHITPQAIRKERTMGNLIQAQQQAETRAYVEPEIPAAMVADPVVEHMTAEQIEKSIKATRRKMEEAAKRLDFVEAAHLRDEMLRMEERAKEMRE